MRKTFAAFKKEWALLWRDKVGLIFLFVLPICLVLFITLTDTSNSDNAAQLNILLLNQDHGQVAKDIVDGLKKIEHFNVQEIGLSHEMTAEEGKAAVAKGEYQALIIIPAKTTDNIERYVKQAMLSLNVFPDPPKLQILLDPAVPGPMKEEIVLAMQLFAKHIESNVLSQVIAHLANKSKFSIEPGILLIKDDYLQLPQQQKPNTVQQNVPAWALFAMFFIITPLSGVMVKERNLGVMNRLRISPVSFITWDWPRERLRRGIASPCRS